MVPAVKCVIFWHHVDTAGVLWENQCHVRLAEFQSRVKILSLSRKRNADKIWQAYAVRFAASNIRNVITRSAITPTQQAFFLHFSPRLSRCIQFGSELEASCHWKGTSQACLPASHGDVLHWRCRDSWLPKVARVTINFTPPFCLVLLHLGWAPISLQKIARCGKNYTLEIHYSCGKSTIFTRQNMVYNSFIELNGPFSIAMLRNRRVRLSTRCFHSHPFAGAAMTRFHHTMEVSGAVIVHHSIRLLMGSLGWQI